MRIYSGIQRQPSIGFKQAIIAAHALLTCKHRLADHGMEKNA